MTFEIWSRYAEAHGQALDGRFTFRLVLTAVLLIVVLAQLNYRFIETHGESVGWHWLGPGLLQPNPNEPLMPPRF